MIFLLLGMPSKKKTTPKASLIPDVWRLIFSQLQLKDLMACGAVCQHWRKLLLNDHCWKAAVCSFWNCPLAQLSLPSHGWQHFFPRPPKKAKDPTTALHLAHERFDVCQKSAFLFGLVTYTTTTTTTTSNQLDPPLHWISVTLRRVLNIGWNLSLKTFYYSGVANRITDKREGYNWTSGQLIASARWSDRDASFRYVSPVTGIVMHYFPFHMYVGESFSVPQRPIDKLICEPMLDYIVTGDLYFSKRNGYFTLSPQLLRFYSSAPPPEDPSGSAPVLKSISVENEEKTHLIRMDYTPNVLSGKALPITLHLTSESDEKVLIHQVELSHMTEFVYLKGMRVVSAPATSVLKSALADRQPKVPPLEKSHPVLETAWRIPWDCVPSIDELVLNKESALRVSYSVVMSMKIGEKILTSTIPIGIGNEATL